MRPSAASVNPVQRVRIWYVALLFVLALFAARLFYLQVLRHNHYRSSALSSQLKEYEIRAERGVIEAYDGDKTMPIVLNEPKYTLFADPKFVKDPDKAAVELQAIVGGDAVEYSEKMRAQSRYAVLVKKLNKEQKTKIEALKLKGIGTREESYRTYPQGELAAQLLGFVNDEGDGKYGIEQYLDNELKGKPGLLKAITDASGVPLAANKENTIIEPQTGKRVVITIDLSMQRQLEDILKAGLDNAKSKSGSALILDPYSGKIKAMANFPTYNPAEFFKVEDAAVFNNANVSAPVEPGSIMKPLTVGAALETGAIKVNSEYDDPGFFKVDNETIENVEEVAGAAHRTVTDILTRSLNTGATWMLMQMGGGQINEKARTTWHDYMANHYQLGKLTGIEQGYEAEGTVPSPTEGFGLNIRFANTSFGQGMTATPLQMGAALSSLINGGTYYKPHLVDIINDNKKQPEIVRAGVVSDQTSSQVRGLMEAVVTRNHAVYGMPHLPSRFKIGGKTGTAQIARPEGGYYEDKYNGLFYGFVGGDLPEYVIVVRVNEPGIPGYAGSKAAGPIFSSLAIMLTENFNVKPKS